MRPLKPKIFIPTLYFAEGLPFTIANQMSVVFYKNMGADNTVLALATSILYLPWTVKFAWSPLVDVYGTKRKWIVVAQAVLGCIAALMAASVFLPDWLYVSVGIFLIMGIASATQDVAIDGYYLDVLKPEQQAFYVGVRSAFYKVAWLLGSGGLVFLAGKIAETTALGVKGGWSVAFATCAVLLLLLSAFHTFALPETGSKETAEPGSTEKTTAHLTPKEFLRVFTTWLNQRRIVAIIIYILIFRAGDALMLKMAQPFLLDTVEKGGLAIQTSDVGIIYGTIGVLFLLGGGIVGGALVSKLGVRRCLMPTALIMNSAIVLYWWLAMTRPSGPVELLGFNLTEAVRGMTDNTDVLRWFDARLFCTIVVNSLEQFSYGLGTAAYTVFLLTTVRSEYKAAHYAIATAIMALGVMLPGFISGKMADTYGYETFFLISFLASIPGIISIFWLPFEEPEKIKA